MKYILCLVVFVSSLSAAAQNETVLMNAVKAKLDKVADYQASGQMKIDVSFIKAPQSAITAYYKKPDKFKIKKSDGISLLPKGGVTININALLTTDNYTVVPAGNAVVQGIATKVVKLLPLAENSDVVLTTLYIDDKALVVRKTSVVTKENGSYEMELYYGKWTAWGLPDKVMFIFNTKDYKLPKGVTFDYEKGGPKKAPTPNDNKGTVEITYSQYIINKGVPDAVFKN